MKIAVLLCSLDYWLGHVALEFYAKSKCFYLLRNSFMHIISGIYTITIKIIVYKYVHYTVVSGILCSNNIAISFFFSPNPSLHPLQGQSNLFYMACYIYTATGSIEKYLSKREVGDIVIFQNGVINSGSGPPKLLVAC